MDDRRLVRFAYVCAGLLVADLLVLVISFGTCDDQKCPTWQEWVNTITYLGGFALLVLTVGAALAILLRRARRN